MFVSMTRRCLMAAAIASFFSLPMAVPAQAQSGAGGIGGISSSSAGANRGAIRSSRKYGRRAGRGGKRGFGGRRAGRFSSGKGWFAGQRWFGRKRSRGGRIGVASTMTGTPQRSPIRHHARRGAHSALKGYPLSRYSPVAYVTEEYIRERDAALAAPVGRLDVAPVSRVVRLPAVRHVRHVGKQRRILPNRVRHWSKGSGASSRIKVWRPAR